MLVLSRKFGQSVQIGQDIFVTVTLYRGKIRLEITAPGDVHILRENAQHQDFKPTTGGTLKLGMKIDQVVNIGETNVRVLGRNGNIIRLGFTAPRSVQIRRVELDDRDVA